MLFVLRRQLNWASREALRSFICSKRNYCSSVPKEATSSTKQYILKTLGLGIIAGGAYAWYAINYDLPKAVTTISSDELMVQSSTKIIKKLPNVTFARQIKIPEDKSNLELVLFQYPTCPFCCKVRAFLDYYGLSYNVVEVDPVLRQQIRWSDYKKVPILLVRSGDIYLQLNDSSMIVSCLATYLKSKKKISIEEIQEFYPNISGIQSDAKNKSVLNKYFLMNGDLDKNQLEIDKEERQWRRWADEVLVHMLSPNVYRTKEEAFEAFNWFSEVGEWERLFPSWERKIIINVGAYAMYFVGKRLKKKHNLKDNVRASLYDECNVWLKEVKKRGKFFGGSSPNLADLAVYGVLCSIEGCQTFKELLENTKIGTWYSDMKTAVEIHNGASVLQ